MLPHDPAGSKVGTLSMSARDASVVPVFCIEDVAGLLGFLAVGGALAGAVKGLLAHLPVTDQDHHHDEPEACAVDSGGEGSVADGTGSVDSEGLFTGDSGDNAALVADAEGHRAVSVEETGASRTIGPGAVSLGGLVAACHRLAAWVSWDQFLAAVCLITCGELSNHPDQ